MANPNPSPFTRFSTSYHPDPALRKLTKRQEVVKLQQEMLARATNPETANKDSSACACAYERLERLLRAMSMQPDPRPMDMLEAAREARKMKRVPQIVLEVGEEARISSQTMTTTGGSPA